MDICRYTYIVWDVYVHTKRLCMYIHIYIFVYVTEHIYIQFSIYLQYYITFYTDVAVYSHNSKSALKLRLHFSTGYVYRAQQFRCGRKTARTVFPILSLNIFSSFTLAFRY